MSLSIPIKYLSGEDDNIFRPSYIITAPKGEPSLDGYILRQPKEYAYTDGKSIVIEHGNEWVGEKKEFRYMLERREKVPGKKSKRYRYSEEEMIQLYGRSESKTYDERLQKRSRIVSSGSGSLIRARYSVYDNYDKRTVSGWLLSPDADSTWVYELGYDPLRDIGKHSRKARGFSLEESYHVDDISVIRDSAKQLISLLNRLDAVREIVSECWRNRSYIYGADGDLVYAQSVAENISYSAYNDFIPKAAREKNVGGEYVQKPEALETLQKLTQIATKMEEECRRLTDAYRHEKASEVCRQIRSLTGIDISEDAPKKKEEA